MDWTMISNAQNYVGRILTLHYLLTTRYQATPEYAAQKLREVPKSNGLWGELLVELKAELIADEIYLDTGGLGTDEEVRKYFSDMLAVYYT